MTGEGVYSLIQHRWLQIPSWTVSVLDIIHRPTFLTKLQSLKNYIDHLVSSNAPVSSFDDLKLRIKAMRSSGLHNGGEFSVENLIFKELRNEGYLDRINDYIHQVRGP